MDPLIQESFEAFLRERQYILNVTLKTLKSYRDAWRAFSRTLPMSVTLAELGEADIRRAVAVTRTRGVSPFTINTYFRAINVWLKWAGKPFRAPRQVEPSAAVPIFSSEHLRRIFGWRPPTPTLRRIWVFSALVLDTGLRASEALGLTRRDIDFDNMLLNVLGKGRKVRLVPFSLAGRKLLWRWLQSHSHNFVFGTRTGTALSVRNAERNVATMCKKLGIVGVRRTVHALRHTFATNYLRNGGDPFRLQRILGHASLEMTRRYVHLQTADLSAVHNQFSPLARA